MLCRYVERNALRAKLVTRAQLWRWCSAWFRARREEDCRVLSDWPVERPSNWSALLNEPQREQDEAQVRTSIARGRPLGDAKWVERTARRWAWPTRSPPWPPARHEGRDERPSRRKN